MVAKFRFLLYLFVVASFNLNCSYNEFQRLDETVNASWAEVLNQYQRRYDLIPNLVKTVQGYAKHEKSVFTEIAEARSRVGAIQATPELLANEAKMKEFLAAQNRMGGALSRLLAVAENYPQLKADQNFLSLQAQLEGTENRIAVARKRYIDAVRSYNILVRSFPSLITARIMGYQPKPQFTVEDEKSLSKPPEVNFE